MKATGIFVILLSQDGVESDSSEGKFLRLRKGQFEKVTVQKTIAELSTVISNQMIKYQLPQTPLNQISDHKHDIYLNGKLSNKQLAQAANKNAKFMFTKTGLLLLLSVVSEVTVWKNSKQTLP